MFGRESVVMGCKPSCLAAPAQLCASNKRFGGLVSQTRVGNNSTSISQRETYGKTRADSRSAHDALFLPIREQDTSPGFPTSSRVCIRLSRDGRDELPLVRQNSTTRVRYRDHDGLGQRRRCPRESGPFAR